jgi:zinc protease
MLRWLHAAFDRMPAGNGPSRTISRGDGYTPKHLTQRKPVQQVYAALGFPTPPSTHPDHEALDLLAAVLGEGRSSRLVQTLREKQKLVFAVTAANYGHEGPGIFSIFAECSPARRKELRPAVERVIRSFLRSLTQQELTRAKNMIQNAWLQSFETYHQQASTVGLYALDNQLERLETYLPRLLAVTPSQLAMIAGRYFKSRPLSSAVIAA